MNKDYMYFYNKVSSANVSSSARTVYRALLHYANRETWSCFPSIRTITNDTGMSRSTVMRCLKELEREELIMKIHRLRKDRGKTSNMYFFN